MSRSFKKHAFTGVTVAESEKWHKVRANRRLRVALRGNLARLDYERAEVDVPENPWLWPKDGRHCWIGTDEEALMARK